MYIWQHPNWPEFTYNLSEVEDILYRYALETGIMTGAFSQVSTALQNDAIVDLMIAEATKTSEIEGEKLVYDDLRSSIRNQLGIDTSISRNQDPRAFGIAQLLISNRNTFQAPLTKEMLFEWHKMVISDPSQRQRLIDIAKWRSPETDPMQIISGPIGREIVHYEAPPSVRVDGEMDRFISWFNETDPLRGTIKIAGPVRAAIAHLYFECIHPFADGNGRIGRAVSEKALSQELGTPVLLKFSETIWKCKKDYYQELSFASKNSLDITGWISFFIKVIYQAQLEAKETIHFVLKKSQFWKKYAGLLNLRQEKVLSRMFKEGPSGFQGGINAKKYMTITDCSKATATRDIAELLNLGCIYQLPGGGRSTSYEISSI